MPDVRSTVKFEARPTDYSGYTADLNFKGELNGCRLFSAESSQYAGF